jgi:hypothetical protein
MMVFNVPGLNAFIITGGEAVFVERVVQGTPIK